MTRSSKSNTSCRKRSTTKWRAHLGADGSTVHDLYLHTLGNLTLTGYNKELSNDLFAAKRQRFAKSHLELNCYFKTVEQWRQADIEQRAAVLTERALQCWPYFGDVATAISGGDDVTGAKPESVTVLGTTHPVKNWREVLTVTLEALVAAAQELTNLQRSWSNIRITSLPAHRCFGCRGRSATAVSSKPTCPPAASSAFAKRR